MTNTNQLKAEIANGINTANEATIKARLSSLPVEERKKLVEEASGPTKEKLAKLIEEIERSKESPRYSLDGIEEATDSKLVENILGNPLMRAYFKSYGEKVLPKEVYNGPRDTLEIIYFEKAISEINLTGFIKAGGSFLGTTFSGLFSKNEKGETSIDFGALASLSGDLSGETQTDEAKELLGRSNGRTQDAKLKFAQEFLKATFKGYDTNLRILQEHKDKAGFSDLMNDPKALSAVLNTGKYQAAGIDIDLKAKRFQYTTPSDIETQRESFLKEIIAKIDKNGKTGENLVANSEKYDGFFKLFDNGGIFGIIAKFVAEIFGFSVDKTKDALDFVKNLMKSGERDISLNNLREYAGNKGKKVVTGPFPKRGKEIRSFSKAIGDIRFTTKDDGTSSAQSNPNFWPYLLTGEGADGKEIADLTEEMKTLRKIVQEEILNGVNPPISGTTLFAGLNKLDSGSIQKQREKNRQVELDAEKQRKVEEERQALQRQQEPRNSPVAQSSPTEYISGEEHRARATNGSTPSQEGTNPKSVETREHPFSQFEIVGNIRGNDLRFDKAKGTIIIGERAYGIDSLKLKGFELKTQFKMKEAKVENGELIIVFEGSHESRDYLNKGWDILTIGASKEEMTLLTELKNTGFGTLTITKGKIEDFIKIALNTGTSKYTHASLDMILGLA